MAARGLVVHAGILVVSSLLALRTFTHEEKDAAKPGEVALWSGSPSQVTEVRFEAKTGSLVLEPHEDKQGRYFIGTVKKVPGAEKPADPHAAPSASATPPEPPASTEPKTTRFVSAKDGEDLFGKVASLQALRVLGKVPEAQQKAEFGFTEPAEKMTLKIGGKDRTLIFGSTTPGGSDHYVKDPVNGELYVIAGSIYRTLENAGDHLMERKLHAFESSAPKRLKITQGSASREIVRSTEKTDAWTKPDAPKEKDETATNWLAKVDRLHVTEYVGEKLEASPSPAEVVVRLDYFDDRRNIGFLELVKLPPAAGSDKPEYVARTEQTRWYAKVVRSAAEQVEQDVKSVVTP